jgi:hypothetical protein
MVYKIIRQNCGSMPHDLSRLTESQLRSALQTATNILDVWKGTPVTGQGWRAMHDQSCLARISKQTHRQRPSSGL